MLGNDQIREVAQSLVRTADERIHAAGDAQDQLEIWEAVRRSCRVVEAVSDLDREDLNNHDRAQRARFLVAELESALESARRARDLIESSARWERDI